jgi:cardiolipin synthase (CMP-forming)
MNSIIKVFRKLPSREKRLTFATILTLFRFLLIPFVVVSMIFQSWGLAFLFFLLAAISDVLDGYMARLFNQKTFLGACLDPVADKLLTLSIFTTLAFVQSPLFSIPKWFVLIVLVKELILVFGALTIILLRGKITIHPTLLGKLTMMVQVFFIIWLFACYFFKWLPFKTYRFSLGLVLAFVILSLIDYIRIGWQQAKKMGYLSV